MVRKEPGQLHRYPAVTRAGRFPHNEHTSDKLGVLIGQVEVQQLVRGHQSGWHSGNVGPLGGHSNTACNEVVNAASTARSHADRRSSPREREGFGLVTLVTPMLNSERAVVWGANLAIGG
jgi:hypothetical protein